MKLIFLDISKEQNYVTNSFLFSRRRTLQRLKVIACRQPRKLRGLSFSFKIKCQKMVYYVPIKFENITSTLIQGLEKGMCSIKYIRKGIFFFTGLKFQLSISSVS